MAATAKAAKPKKAKKPPKPKDDRPVPGFFDEEGKLRKLKGKDFPATREGRMAYCDYQVERWKLKRVAAEKRGDPLARKKAKVEKYKKLLAELEAEIEFVNE